MEQQEPFVVDAVDDSADTHMDVAVEDGEFGFASAMGNIPPEPSVTLEVAESKPVGGFKTAAEAFGNIHKFLAGPEWDLEVLKEAGKIRRDAERYKAARALPGGSNVV
jgi:hypothetical protein